LWAGSRLALGTVTIRGIPNCLNYCEMFIVYTPGGLRVGDSYLKGKCKAMSSVRQLNTMPMRAYVKFEGIPLCVQHHMELVSLMFRLL